MMSIIDIANCTVTSTFLNEMELPDGEKSPFKTFTGWKEDMKSAG